MCPKHLVLRVPWASDIFLQMSWCSRSHSLGPDGGEAPSSLTRMAVTGLPGSRGRSAVQSREKGWLGTHPRRLFPMLPVLE